MAKLITRRWQNGNSKNNGYGKFYQRVVITEILSTDEFAQHIASHGSPYTRDVINGVLMAACDCLVELCMDSKAVRLSDLGIFKMGIHAEGTEDEKKANADKVQRVELQFLPNQSKAYNLSSTNLRKKASLVGIDQLMGSEDDEADENGENGSNGTTNDTNDPNDSGENGGSNGGAGTITPSNGDNNGGGDNGGGDNGGGNNGGEHSGEN